MSAVCCAAVEQAVAEDVHVPWWKDRAVHIPAASGVAFLAGLISEWTGAGIVALVLFWTGLLLGASTLAQPRLHCVSCSLSARSESDLPDDDQRSRGRDPRICRGSCRAGIPLLHR